MSSLWYEVCLWSKIAHMEPTKRIKPHRAAFLEDLRVLWDRGLRVREGFAEALHIPLVTLNRRMARCRADGHLPPAVPGTTVFDPFGKLVPFSRSLYDGGQARRPRTTTTRSR